MIGLSNQHSINKELSIRNYKKKHYYEFVHIWIQFRFYRDLNASLYDVDLSQLNKLIRYTHVCWRYKLYVFAWVSSFVHKHYTNRIMRKNDKNWPRISLTLTITIYIRNFDWLENHMSDVRDHLSCLRTWSHSFCLLTYFYFFNL